MMLVTEIIIKHSVQLTLTISKTEKTSLKINTITYEKKC